MKRINFLLVTISLAVVFLIIEIVVVKTVSKYEPQISIVYAAARIPANTKIQADMLLLKKVDLSMVNRLAVRDVKSLTGKKTKVDIEEDEIFLSTKAADENEMDEIKVMDKNNRLFALELKGDQANGWWLMADQYVDIIFVPDERVVERAQRQQSPGLTAREEQVGAGITPDYAGITRLNNIRVAALIDEKGKILANSGRTTLPRYVSLEVSNRQDEFLAYAKNRGKLELSIVPPK